MHAAKNRLVHLLGALGIAAGLAACDGNGRHDYSYYKDHPDEAKAFSDQCTLNGTSGMVAEQISQCDAARTAYGNRNFNKQ